MQFMFLIQLLFVVLRQVLSASQIIGFLLCIAFLVRFLIYFLIIIGILQSIDTITSLYENNFPMRFGVILYSTKFVKHMELTGGGIYSSTKENDSQNEDDISSLVIFSFFCSFSYLSCISTESKLFSTFILSVLSAHDME